MEGIDPEVYQGESILEKVEVLLGTEIEDHVLSIESRGLLVEAAHEDERQAWNMIARKKIISSES